ncbi:MAG TPA: 3-oxoacyl-ACP reductase family protein [Tepidisphaeraceae bacterium]|jgi:3-oxoacyl-[acyl-carrier protein] reductase|nr:3-oxoacyl-ACP reductase family protein [Tepidisphaeraceae bacterium]
MSDQTQSQTLLKGKLALVTGGSRGIGAAISRKLAASGATVLVNFAKSEKAASEVVAAIKEAGGAAHAIGGDVADPAQVKRMFETIDRQHGGKVDIVVNNAGVFLSGPLTDFSDADFEKTIAVNVRAVFLVAREAAKRMGQGGRVITIGSNLGERAIGAGMSVYTASKFAVAGLARGWAHDLAPRGITSNLVQPGPIDTDMNPADATVNPMAESMRQLVPAKRYGTGDEVASVVAYLASPAAQFVNGATINVDGGMNA